MIKCFKPKQFFLDKGNPSKPKQIQNAFFDDDFIN